MVLTDSNPGRGRLQWRAASQLVALALSSSLLVCACAPARVQRSPAADAGLLAQMQPAFSAKNPAATRIRVLHVIADPAGDGRKLAALATALTPIPVTLDDELFGVFVVDSTLTRVEQTVEVFSSGRLLDYAVLIDFPAADTLRVRGFGQMDHSAAFEHMHAWGP